MSDALQTEQIKDKENSNIANVSLSNRENHKQRNMERRKTMSIVQPIGPPLSTPPTPVLMFTPLRTVHSTLHENADTSSPLTTTTTTAEFDETPLPSVPAAKDNTFKREATVREIVTTEHTYVEGIQKILDSYIIPLRASYNATKGPITLKQIEDIFRGIEQILALNTEILRQLDEKIKQPPPQCFDIGGIMLKNADTFRLYLTYVLNNPISCETLITLERTNKAFSEFLQKASPKGLKGLDDLLILPIQRLPRYQLMMNQLLQCTEETHPDYWAIKIATKKITDNNVLLNKRKGENESVAMVSIMNKMVYETPSDFILIDPKRKFICQGALHFDAPAPIGNRGKLPSAKSPYAVLFNDFLLFVDKTSDNKLKYKDHWDTRRISLDPVPPNWWIEANKPTEDIKNRSFSLSVFSSGAIGSAILAVTAVTEDQKKSWVEHINNCLVSISTRPRSNTTNDQGGIPLPVLAELDCSESASATETSSPLTKNRQRSQTMQFKPEQLRELTAVMWRNNQQTIPPPPPPTTPAPSVSAPVISVANSKPQQQQVQLPPPPPPPPPPPITPLSPQPPSMAVTQTVNGSQLITAEPNFAGLLESLNKEATEIANAQSSVAATIETATQLLSVQARNKEQQQKNATDSALIESVRKLACESSERLKRTKALQTAAESRFTSLKAQLASDSESLVGAHSNVAKKLSEAEALWTRRQETEQEIQEILSATKMLESRTTDLQMECSRVSHQNEIYSATVQRIVNDIEEQARELSQVTASKVEVQERYRVIETALIAAQKRREELLQEHLHHECEIDALYRESARLRDSLATETAAKASAHRTNLELQQTLEHQQNAVANEVEQNEMLNARQEKLVTELSELSSKLETERKLRREVEECSRQLKEQQEKRELESQQRGLARQITLFGNAKIEVDTFEVNGRFVSETEHRLVAADVPAPETQQPLKALRIACIEKLRQAEAMQRSLSKLQQQQSTTTTTTTTTSDEICPPPSTPPKGESSNATHQTTPATKKRKHKHHGKTPSSSASTCTE